jgi:hypothetical protein
VDIVLGLIGGWIVLTMLVLRASYSDSRWASHLLAANVIVGVAISGAILMLP